MTYGEKELLESERVEERCVQEHSFCNKRIKSIAQQAMN